MHGPFNQLLFTIGDTDSPLCRNCLEAKETTEHVILECNKVVFQSTIITSLDLILVLSLRLDNLCDNFYNIYYLVFLFC